jgi:hypothetical protein
VFNHFQELRFQIDENRERLKAKIDDVALEMIEQTKKCEAEYLKELKLESNIDSNQPIELIKLCEFTPNDKWTLLYRGSRDGFGSKDFHSKCDNKSPTLSICKAHASYFIFGGFTMVCWEISSIWKSDANAFIFSQTNKDNKPVKMKYDP